MNEESLQDCGTPLWESLEQQGHQSSQRFPKGNQPWIIIGRTDAEAEAPITWPRVAKSQLTGKDPNAGKDWRQEEKGIIEDELAGWYHQLNGHEFEQILGDGEGQGRLVCYSPWGHKESDMTEWLNNKLWEQMYSLRQSLHQEMKKESESLFKKNNAWKFPNLERDMDTHHQSQRSLNRLNSKRSSKRDIHSKRYSPRHNIINSQK